MMSAATEAAAALPFWSFLSTLMTSRQSDSMTVGLKIRCCREVKALKTSLGPCSPDNMATLIAQDRPPGTKLAENHQ